MNPRAPQAAFLFGRNALARAADGVGYGELHLAEGVVQFAARAGHVHQLEKRVFLLHGAADRDAGFGDGAQQFFHFAAAIP